MSAAIRFELWSAASTVCYFLGLRCVAMTCLDRMCEIALEMMHEPR